MNEAKILIFAGTTEGRRLAEYLAKRQVRTHVCVATEYGESLLTEKASLTVTHERMDSEKMCEFIDTFAPDYVVDATHPYAQEVTMNIQSACRSRQCKYLRLLRSESEYQSDCIYVDSVEEAVEVLAGTEGNILVTTGSKELFKYTALPDYQNRIYARVLSTGNVAVACEQLGIAGRHLICMQGPFSAEMNLALLKEFDISYMVTKESGAAGGFLQKCEAARQCGAKLIIIGRPLEETGIYYEDAIKFLKKEFNLHTSQEVILAGIGMGSRGSSTVEVLEACHRADVLIGAARMLDAVKEPGQKTYQAYRADDIAGYITEHPEDERIVVVLSGDPGFYSGAKKLLEAIERIRKEHSDLEIHTDVMPGISTVVYLSAKLGIPWEATKLVSIHGRKENLLAAVREHKRTFTLAGSVQDIRNLAESLLECGMEHVMMHVGQNLSYEEEEIWSDYPKAFTDYHGNALAAVIIENPDGGTQAVTHGIPDGAFLRGNVPMTKEEVRSISLSKMRIRRSDVIYDIGAGTGSVSVESALQAVDGQVYAVEINPEATALIRANCDRFAVRNLSVIEGGAPEAMEDLPAPDVVFIGGSKGHLDEILDLIRRKNPIARIVINAISLETLAQAIDYCRKNPIVDEEIVQVNVAKSRTIGRYHMMTGQNPIYIISFTLTDEEVTR